MKRGQRINPAKFYWGQKCKHNPDHVNDDGKSLKLPGLKQSTCCMCNDRFAGMTADEIIAKVTYEFENFGPATPEEARLKQIEYSRAWTKRNMDRHKVATKKYLSSLSEEKRAELNKKQMERYWARREQMLESQRRRYHERKQKDNDEHSGT